ncbi:Protein GUCD1 [Mizuhopecten yessoensis]|uniref:Protein GUCD1 n=1 Tax=Mizuhopecten yessoensis TaxID=6573 RepID=A0A210R2W4_MIZYE|nr:Protein GUCD1 [Mizuhopecten yessoensis]
MEEAKKYEVGIKTKERDADSQRQVQLKVPTHMQSYSWDCGLACCCMVLRYLKKDDHNVYTSDFEELNCGESIWTIDLAYLLEKHDLKVKLTTVTLGVDQEYAKKPFYRSHFSQDENRVGKMFSEAASKNIEVEKCSVPMSDIVNHLAKENLLICLVDWNFLECIWCDKDISWLCAVLIEEKNVCSIKTLPMMKMCAVAEWTDLTKHGKVTELMKILFSSSAPKETLGCCRIVQFYPPKTRTFYSNKV